MFGNSTRMAILLLFGTSLLSACAGARQLGTNVAARGANAAITGAAMTPQLVAETQATPADVVEQIGGARRTLAQIEADMNAGERQASRSNVMSTAPAPQPVYNAPAPIQTDTNLACTYGGSVFQPGDTIGGDFAPVIDIRRLQSFGQRRYGADYERHSARRCSCKSDGWQCLFT